MIDDRITLRILGNDVDLDHGCWNCSVGKTGPKGKDDTFWTEDGVCEICRGTGYELTDNGKKILEFLKRHVGRSDV